MSNLTYILCANYLTWECHLHVAGLLLFTVAVEHVRKNYIFKL
jgi:hypothetical protein